MSTDLRHREIEDILAAYALDAVDATEAATVEAHLAGCPLCRAELDGYRETAAALGTAVAA
ncbi:MAG TPA: zf-HC2 domain-containing protein, partial [Acidimicrobiales bacterium]